MNREDALNYKARWQLVNERTAREAREMSPAFKLEQLALMYEAGQQLGWNDDRSADEEEVRERWRRLREFYRARG
jgi:hypothetical protein